VLRICLSPTGAVQTSIQADSSGGAQNVRLLFVQPVRSPRLIFGTRCASPLYFPCRTYRPACGSRKRRQMKSAWTRRHPNSRAFQNPEITRSPAAIRVERSKAALALIRISVGASPCLTFAVTMDHPASVRCCKKHPATHYFQTFSVGISSVLTLQNRWTTSPRHCR